MNKWINFSEKQGMVKMELFEGQDIKVVLVTSLLFANDKSTYLSQKRNCISCSYRYSQILGLNQRHIESVLLFLLCGFPLYWLHFRRLFLPGDIMPACCLAWISHLRSNPRGRIASFCLQGPRIDVHSYGESWEVKKWYQLKEYDINEWLLLWAAGLQFLWGPLML